ncbi:MAG TPA: hypothetical protein VH583_03240 [Vicinamibacterales bacterium]|jgi:hypothetical protein
MINTLVFLSIRVLHVLLAGTWIGVAVFVAMFLAPVVDDLGPAGGSVMVGLARRGMTTFVPIVAGMTILSGVWLYWRFTGGFDPAISRTPSGLAFGVGGAFGLMAAIIGGAVINRGGKRLMTLAAQTSTMRDGPEKAALLVTIAALRRQVAFAGRVVVVLLTITLTLMAIGHYV